jgi:hypothetical protein
VNVRAAILAVHDSSTIIAAPSPSTNPLRFLAKGLHDVDASSGSSVANVFSAAQAFSVPNVSGASLPPAIITSASPVAMRFQASPIATDDEEQALEYVRFGPSR